MHNLKEKKIKYDKLEHIIIINIILLLSNLSIPILLLSFYWFGNW